MNECRENYDFRSNWVEYGRHPVEEWRNGLQICHWLLFQDPEIRMGFQIFTVQSTPFPRKEISKKKKKKKKKNIHENLPM